MNPKKSNMNNEKQEKKCYKIKFIVKNNQLELCNIYKNIKK